ncbi:probable asparagine--tRNA ligase, mitochondrial [Toxorhynchites rutilus septentrionalis]|uniref:probable asparagine--tRNA ligase, mitochondrial n=1 Tax=Toxorhynchites rutilus septentrionalis TaxID=329112 RepID=UPI00247A60BD|nr:probable asparagine--tRNA ligase, mitochondrial [Toxorhynchites rutilus septentrionalis]
MLKHISNRLRFNNYILRNTVSRFIYRLSMVKNVSCGKHKEEDKIQIKGWVKSVRKMKETVFLDLNDGTCPNNLQLVTDKTQSREIAYGSSIDASGTLARTSKNHLELKVELIREIGKCPLSEGYPFYPKKSYQPEYIRSHLNLRSQVSSISSTLRVRHKATKCFNDYLDREGFFQIHTPIITSNDCEGAGEAFLVKPANEQVLKQMTKRSVPSSQEYFDRQAYLTVSGQLHLESTSLGLSKVYTFGPTFRAENSKSPIHLSEFYMLELEEAFMDTLDALAYRTESMIKFVTKSLLEVGCDDIAAVRHLTDPSSIEDSFSWIDKPFPRLSFNEAIQILERNKSKLKSVVRPEEGLNKEQELFLVNHCQGPLFVVNWPKSIKSFYMRENIHNSDLVDALDLLVPRVGELVGGSVRENDYEKLKAKLPDQEALRWYLDLRRFGSVTTAGFGLGFERYLCWVLSVHNVRDVIPFPRWAHNCDM